VENSRYYFCYSSSLDSEAFDLWKQNHGYLDFKLGAGQKAKLPGYRLSFNLFSNYWGGRVLGLEPDSKSEVEGIVFEIASKDWPIIEHKEGLKTGLSQVQELEVLQLESNKTLRCFVFGTPEQRKTNQGPVSSTFKELMLKAYNKWGLMTDLNSFC
jgi:gamma-glutamylcyclotransferase